MNNEQTIQELLVLIDTLQTNLRSVISHVPEQDREKIQTPSLKWCLNWTQSEIKR